MNMLFSILVLFSQAFAIIINQSNVDETFMIDSVEGIGCIAVTQEFIGTLKLRFSDQYAYGGNIQQVFYEYIVFTLQLSDSERDPIHELINQDNCASSDLIPFENILSIIKSDNQQRATEKII